MNLQEVASAFLYLRLIDLVDIGLLALVIYWLLSLIQGTRAFPILIGCALLLGAYTLVGFLELDAIGWLLENVFGFAVVIMAVLFQGDIRNALAKVGLTTLRREGSQTAENLVGEVVKTAQTLCGLKIGASIVLERETGLRNYIENGRPLNADCRSELLQAIFHPASPLHDGAAIITRNGKIAAARCILPLAASQSSPQDLGTRHRSALGLSQETDALVLIVSEEKRTISLAYNGKLYRNLSTQELKENLIFLLGKQMTRQPSTHPLLPSQSHAIQQSTPKWQKIS